MLYHGDIDVLGQFCAKFIDKCLYVPIHKLLLYSFQEDVKQISSGSRVLVTMIVFLVFGGIKT